jgi:hypothetical protein
VEVLWVEQAEAQLHLTTVVWIQRSPVGRSAVWRWRCDQTFRRLPASTKPDAVMWICHAKSEWKSWIELDSGWRQLVSWVLLRCMHCVKIFCSTAFCSGNGSLPCYCPMPLHSPRNIFCNGTFWSTGICFYSVLSFFFNFLIRFVQIPKTEVLNLFMLEITLIQCNLPEDLNCLTVAETHPNVKLVYSYVTCCTVTLYSRVKWGKATQWVGLFTSDSSGSLGKRFTLDPKTKFSKIN